MTNKTPINPQKSPKPITNHPKSFSNYILIVFLIITTHCPKSQSSIATSLSSPPTPPPLPILPIPTSNQLSWQLTEMALFFHFGPNTFTNSEWGTGHADPSVFNPKSLNATQWVNVAKDSGFSRVILTAKHHDGFCLWPSQYTDYSVRSSPWRNGSGDVVKELAEAASNCGVQLGLYLSPWDRHEPCYGKTLEYNEYYLGQMTELLTGYGEIKEVWLDGAKGEGEKSMEYFFDDWFSLIHQLQPRAVIFSDAGPDVRWVGDEAGVAGTTSWSLFNRSATKIGDIDPVYSGGGDPFGHDWVPAECDVSIRPGWFWHPSESPKSAITLLDLYYKSVGRNCVLLLNVPPNSSGLISQEDIKVLQEFSEIRSSIFSRNLAKWASVSASTTRGGDTNDSRYGSRNVIEEGIYSYWAPDEARPEWILYFDFREAISFNVLMVQEPIQMGQRIIEFHLDILNGDGEWELVTSGTTVGYKRLLVFSSVKTSRLKFVVDKARADPLITYLGLYMDPFSIFGHGSEVQSGLRVNGSEPLKQTANSSLSSYM
ncbi:alpha-l-fucosidase 1 [Phtheirospermum japonicum]|uniref:alpha-L-fucosidase n=1 Tax=Phtheirospermum japonicum TaxID=374723 RepID=A0A830CK68_9LAMI|nr:alpha-l-fucosidase 1 [Phtheirospermum japonicum]